jgi:hypothetical protein
MRDLWLVLILGGIAAFIWLRRGESLRFETVANPDHVMMAAVGVFGRKRRWTTRTLSERNASFSRGKRPNWLIALLRLATFLVPGIVYLVLGSKREDVLVMTAAGPGPHSMVQVTSNGHRGKFAGRSLRTQLEIPECGPRLAGSGASVSR